MMAFPSMDTDIFVIGNGIAGLSVASFLASTGKRVTVVGSGTPWTGLSTSCFALTDETDEDFRRPLSFLRPRLERIGLPFTGAEARKLEVITHFGNQLSCLLAPEFSALETDGSCAVLGLIGHPDVDSGLAAANIRAFGGRAKALWTRLPGMVGMPSAVQFGHQLSANDVTRLSEVLEEIQEETVYLPPLFPLASYARLMKLLQRSRKVGELVTPLSLPGLRFQEAMESLSISEGASLLKGREVVSIQLDGREAISAKLLSGLREQVIKFSHLVLASGDITLSAARSSHLASFRLEQSSEAHKLRRALQTGIEAKNLRAVSREGRVVRNAFVCGAAIPGNNLVLGSGMTGAVRSSWKVFRLIQGGS